MITSNEPSLASMGTLHWRTELYGEQVLYSSLSI